jgi:hypothetical protein
MLNIAVAKVRLQGTRVVPLVGEGKTTGVPEHVRVGLEAELGRRARALDYAREADSFAAWCFLVMGQLMRGGFPFFGFVVLG